MKFNCVKLFLPVLAVAAAFSSCDDSDSAGDVYESSLAQCLTYGQDVATYAQNFNKMSFSVQYDNSNRQVSLSIIGMILPEADGNGVAVPHMEVNGLEWRYNSQGWKVVQAENVTPVITGMSVVPLFKKLQFDLADVFDSDGNYRPGIQYRMDIEYLGSEYELVGCCMTGTTDVTDPDGAEYSPESDPAVRTKPVYWADFDYTASTADIYLYGAKFLGNMPSLNLVFPDIPYSIDNGNIILKADAFDPMFGGVANPAFPISGLSGRIDFSTSSMKIDFTCNFKGSDYKVKIDSKY